MFREIPYGFHWIEKDDVEAVSAVLKGGLIVQGPKVEEFERSLANYTGAKYCVAVSSGTAALHLAVAALELSGGEGITTPNTFVASANCLLYNGLKPVFADIDRETFCLNPKRLREKITRRSKLVIPVDFAGQAAPMREIFALAKKHHLFVVEDAAHALGGKYPTGEKIGSCRYSDLTIFSFHPVKAITTGEGGAITTNHEELAKRLKYLRSHGITKGLSLLKKSPRPWYYEMRRLGFNYRLTDFQAALGLSQLKKLSRFIRRRREIARYYDRVLRGLPHVTVPTEGRGNFSAYHIYVIRVDFSALGKTRREMMERLEKEGVGTQVHYIPVYHHPYYRKRFPSKRRDFPVCEAYYRSALTIPLYPKMTDREVEFVAKKIKKVLT